MIPRYSRPRMAGIWEPENKYRLWFEIEAAVAEAQAELGQLPASAAEVPALVCTTLLPDLPPEALGAELERAAAACASADEALALITALVLTCPEYHLV